MTVYNLHDWMTIYPLPLIECLISRLFTLNIPLRTVSVFVLREPHGLSRLFCNHPIGRRVLFENGDVN